MIKKICLVTFSLVLLLNITTTLAADKEPYDDCTRNVDTCKPKDGVNYSCQRAKSPPPAYLCQPDVFGQIQPPPAIKDFLGNDPTGAAGISKFLSNFITLIYTISAIVLIFMLLWGAFDWMTSEGNKEKLQAAQNKIISAIIGILLFAVAFAIIQVLGAFTGFTFFAGQHGAPTPIPTPRGIWL